MTPHPSASAPAARASSARVRPAAFTLVEALIVTIIVAVLAGIVFVGARRALTGSRAAGERALVVAMRNGVEAFKNDFDALPPLVQDNRPDWSNPPNFGDPEGPVAEVDGVLRPITFLGRNISGQQGTAAVRARRDEEREYLAGYEDGGNPIQNDHRYSTYSLSYYVMGTLDRSETPGPPNGQGKPIDGAQGPRFTKPGESNWFAPGGRVYDAYVDAGRYAKRVSIEDSGAEGVRHAFQDRWTIPIRYYRWLPATGATGKGNLVPRNVGDPRRNPELRDAQYAIVSLGEDGPDTAVSADELDPIEVGGEDPVVELPSDAQAAVNNNIVEVGK